MSKKKPKLNVNSAPILRAVKNYMSRSALFNGALGNIHGDTKHDKAWQDYGWPDVVDFYMLYTMYERNGYGFAGVSIPNELCFLTKPWFQENDKTDADKETPYEKELSKIVNDIEFVKMLKDGDLMQRIGRYSALYLTINDGKDPSQPVVPSKSNKILKATPFYEDQMIPTQLDTNQQSMRFNEPEMYSFSAQGFGTKDPLQTGSAQVHHSRVIIFNEDALGHSIYGMPALKPGFNALLNLQKIQGAGGEGFWRQVAQKFVLRSEDSQSDPLDPDEVDALSEVVRDMFNGMDAMPALNGYDLKPVTTGSLANPKEFLDSNLSEFAASLKCIPKKLLSGTQTGVKAADEDTQAFMRMMQSRRENTITPNADKLPVWLAKYALMPMPDNGVSLCWDDLASPSKAEKVELMKAAVLANRDHILSGAVEPLLSDDQLRDLGGFERDEDIEPMIDANGD